MNLRLVLELQAPRPADDGRAEHGRRGARRRACAIDVAGSSAELGCPVVETVAVKHDGHAQLLALLGAQLGQRRAPTPPRSARAAPRRRARRPTCSAKCAASSRSPRPSARRSASASTTGIDAVVMHPVWGLVLLARRAVPDLPGRVLLGQRADGRDQGRHGRRSARWTSAHMADGPLRSLLVDGVIAGAGSVLVFLPQILILFFFILAARRLRLPAARRLPARQPDGQGRPVGPRLHPAAVELRLRDSRHHGHAHHRRTGATGWRPS